MHVGRVGTLAGVLAWRLALLGVCLVLAGCGGGAGKASPSTDPAPARAAGLAWELVDVDRPRFLFVNAACSVRVVLKNVGEKTWSHEDGDRISYHVHDRAGTGAGYEGYRRWLRAPVKPGETVELDLRVLGPPISGFAELEIEPVREGVAWYGPPLRGVQARFRVWAFLRSGLLQVLAGGVLIGAVWLARRWVKGASGAPDGQRRTLPGSIEWAWLPVTWVNLVLTTVTFSERTRLVFAWGALSVVLSGAAWIAALPALFPGTSRRIAAATVSLAVALLAFADLLYLRFFGSTLPVSAVATEGNVDEVLASVLSLMEPSDLWLAPAPLATLVAAIAWPSRSDFRDEARGVRWGVPAVVVVACLLSGIPFARVARDVLREPLGTHVVSELRAVTRLGVLNAHVLDVLRTLQTSDRRQALPGERERILGWFEQRARALPAAPEDPWFGVARGKNLLLIQVESAQGFIVGARVKGKEVTPYLNELRQTGLYFSHVTDQTGLGMTSDSEYAILSSQHPLGDASVAFLRADNQFFTMAHVLGKEGYSTLSAHPFEKGFWNRAILHPRYGFQRSFFRDELGPGPNVGWGLADGVLFERVIPILEKAQKPVFAFVATLSLHHPFDHFPPALGELDTAGMQNQKLGNYLNAMRYFDRSLRELVDALDRNGLRRDTVVALYGDHDARFGMDPEVLSLAGFDRPSAPAYHLMERIPFFVILPRAANPGEASSIHEVDSLGGHVDIAPTLLHLLGIRRPASFVGMSMVPAGRRAVSPHSDGSAFARSLLYDSRSLHYPDPECHELPGRRAVPLDACSEIRRAAATELRMSRRVVDLDLHRELERHSAGQ